ncbi:4a-hydroxytetrahydrobiopterin dehydratase [Candidatus Woesebacteria bacterium]|nr:4a-hydroxytetrahydrobiopterin dehydratase [Candidatus Woesebacteria bacterium]
MTTSSDLQHQHCVPCEGGTQPLTQAEYAVYLPQVTEWQITSDEKHLERDCSFKNFSAAIEFITTVAKIAESEGHHPDLYLHDFKYVKVSLWTHAINGLSINDFVLATKIDALLTAN